LTFKLKLQWRAARLGQPSAPPFGKMHTSTCAADADIAVRVKTADDGITPLRLSSAVVRRVRVVHAAMNAVAKVL
jgi:hypothetical protein